MDAEKPGATPVYESPEGRKQQSDLDLEQVVERDGYVLNDTSLAHDHGWKTTPDGKTILIPQPRDSPNDPLNWTKYRKHVILIIISCAAFLPDYGSATGAVTLIPQGV